MWFGLRRILARKRVPLPGWLDSGRYLHRPAQKVSAAKAPSMPLERKRKMDGAEKEKKLLLRKWEQQLIEFRSSSKDTLKFPSSLSNTDRLELHKLCARYGLVSKSDGTGDNRALSVTKNKKAKRGDQPQENLYQLPISDASLTLLKNHLKRHPPSEAEKIRAGLIQEPDVKMEIPGWAEYRETEEVVRHRRFSDVAILNTSSKGIELLWKRMVHYRSTKGREMEKQRSSLPVAKYKDAIIKAVAANQVLLISGDTGCGKTTQVPQFLLDEAWSRNKPCRILCTQPRRIAATMVAARVAEERGESLGKTVGYRVMLDRVCGPNTALIYATTGIMLKDLTNSAFQGEWTHLIIDEVHERDHNSDFLLVVLRDLLPRHPDLKVILMSATLHKELFVEYFGNCPSLHVEGRTYPVENYYLDDILRGLRNASPTDKCTQQPRASQEERALVESCIEEAFLDGSVTSIEKLVHHACDHNEGRFLNLQHSGTGLTPLSVAVIHGYHSFVDRFLKLGADPSIRTTNGHDCFKWAKEYNREAIGKMLEQSLPPDAIDEYEPPKIGEPDFDLLVALIQKICHEKKWKGRTADGAILVFLSGWKEIVTLRQQLMAAGFTNDNAVLLCLHSTVAPREQRNAFQPAPPGKHKIVLSTPIAETSITINDVSVVINCGKMKEKSYDAAAGVSTLQNRWISKANEVQRAGRAGRCREGLAFHVYTRAEAQEMDDFVEPELCRIPLEEICLQARVCLERNKDQLTIREFMKKAPNPPSDEAVRRAVTLLVEIGALTEDEQLTVLGKRLASLPMDPRTGKMILYGHLFDCLDPLLTITCAISHRSPWVLFADADDAIKKVRTKMSDQWGGASDHLATIHAFQSFQQAHAKRDFCDSHFLSLEAMFTIDGLRKKILSDLKFKGMQIDSGTLQRNVEDVGLVRALLVCGLYPNVGSLKKRGKILMKDRKVGMLNTSVNSSLKPPVVEDDALPMCPLLAFADITRGDFQIYVRDTTAVQPHPLPLIARQLEVQECVRPFKGPLRTEAEYRAVGRSLVVDSWIKFATQTEAAEAIAILRIRLQDAFTRKISNPRKRLSLVLEDALNAIRKYFSHEAGIDMTSATEEKNADGQTPASKRSSSTAGSGSAAAAAAEDDDDDDESTDAMLVDN